MPIKLLKKLKVEDIFLNKHLKTNELFESVPEFLIELFNTSTYPWEILPKIKEYIVKIVPKGFKEIKKNVFIGENVKIYPNCTIEGTAIIGDGCELRPGAFLRGNVIIGPNCTIGNSTELKNCVLLYKVQVPHYNYVGDSILGNYSHMGAGAICSNLKSDGKNIIIHGQTEIKTGLRKLGAILGDYADVGCGCVLNPGTIIGKNTSVYPLTSLRGVYPKDCIVKTTNVVVKKNIPPQ